ncbi:hypothetical protein [Bacillus amyloliquefaciens]|uniref:hypothetical protein n=1 Tax=Bacillus amyloliquefaciens TaxID=1390 RepID=UPI001CE29830|nr:hypothetical protein [Bacillus amyloliquefaciens]
MTSSIREPVSTSAVVQPRFRKKRFGIQPEAYPLGGITVCHRSATARGIRRGRSAGFVEPVPAGLSIRMPFFFFNSMVFY